jgi:hypothetical protein
MAFHQADLALTTHEAFADTFCLYITLPDGSIGIMYHIDSRDDLDFLQGL